MLEAHWIYPVEEAYLYMTRKTPSAFLQVIQLSKETLHGIFACKLPLPTLLSASPPPLLSAETQPSFCIRTTQ